ncbi:MAG: DUF2834 domain-containing protein [Acidobacteriota bacterium]
MSWKKIVLTLVLVLFLAMTAMVLREHGYLGWFELVNANSATQLVMWDLTICLVLMGIWMFRDARRQQRTVWPYLILTAVVGVAGPLLYLILAPRES